MSTITESPTIHPQLGPLWETNVERLKDGALLESEIYEDVGAAHGWRIEARHPWVPIRYRTRARTAFPECAWSEWSTWVERRHA